MTELPVAACRVVLGTMRMKEEGQGVDEWAAFLEQAFELGVNVLHSSDEYESYPLLCRALAKLRRRRPDIVFRHIVKLSNPGFDESRFDAQEFEPRLAQYCEDLGTSKIDDLQWMWRNGLGDDPARVKSFRDNSTRIADASENLKSRDMINRLFCFPYSLDFAIAAVESGAIDGLAVYRNSMEKEYDTAISRAAELSMPTIVIRPFNAGKALGQGGENPRALFDRALAMPGIEAGIVSTSKIKHLRALAS